MTEKTEKKKIVKMPKGVRMPNGKIKHATVYDPQVFKDICARATKEGREFNDVASECAAIGLFDLKEAQE